MNSSTTPVALEGDNGIGSTHFDVQTTNGDEFNGQETSPTKVPGEIQPTMILQAPAPMVILSSTTPSGSNSGNAATPSSTLASNSPSSASPTPSTPDVDPQIIEALKSKDRIYVLKLGEQMESLIKEKRSRVDLTPASSYQRLLVHRCSAYYRLSPDTDPVTKTIFVQRTPDSRIPERRICELVPPESSSQPTFKIMRRSQGDRRNKPHSQAGSVAGEDGDLSDVEPSEAGSLGGRSTGGSKKHMTIQEREAAYNEARSRIFMGFEEKEKAKEKDMSASSSSLSLNSASASSANGDSLGDLDGSVCSPATESEWSGPPGQYARDRKDHNRRGNSSASSSRSMRSGYHGNHSNPSSRNSRASSPSFKYASLYEPPSQQLYDPNQPPNQMNAPYGTQYYHPFVPQGYMPPYNTGAYHPYPGYPPPHDPHHPPPPPPEPPRPTEHYPQPHMGYPYMWHPPNQPPPIQTTSLGQPGPMQPHQAHQGPAHPVSSPAQSPVQYPYGQPPAQYPYGAPGGYGHPAQGYYAPPPPQSQPMMPPPPPHPSMQMPIPGHVYDSPQSTGPPHGGQPLLNHSSSAPPPHGYAFNPNARSTIGNGPPPPSQAIPNGRHNVRNTVPQPNNGHGNKGRNNPTMARNPWSYGPGISAGGYVGPPAGSSDTVGPRLTSARRQSNLSGGSSRASSYNDDGLSTTSSSTTTSSSSRRTYTSTASSQHPLPPRPDWAVGLKAQPTLARGSHEHSTSPRNPMSPSRGMNGNGHLPPVLQPTDFPPLSSGPSPEKRNPVPSGAWGNNANRAILGPPAGGTSGDGERSLSNPSPKGDSHKLLRRPTGSDGSPGQDRSPGRQADLQANGDILATRMQVLTIEETIAAVESRAAQSEALAAAAAAQGHQANVV